MNLQSDGLALARLSEVAEVLARYGHMTCVPRVECDDGVLTLTVTFQQREEAARALDVLAAADDLRYVCDMAQIRGLSQRYGIDPAALEAVLARRGASSEDGSGPGEPW